MRPNHVNSPPASVSKLATLWRFLLSGTFNTFSTLALYWLLLYVLSPHAAYAVSFACGVALSYLLNLRFVFRQQHTTRKMLLFPLAYLLTYATGALVLQAAIRHLGIPANLAPLLSICCTVPVSFVLLRWLLTDRGSRHGASPTSSPRN